MFRRKDIITAVEIGTSKICVLIGECGEEEEPTIIGHGETPSEQSVRKGEIQDMETVIAKLSEAVEVAERAAGREIDRRNIFLGVTGSHVRSQPGVGSIAISDEDRKVKRKHLEDVLQNAKSVASSQDTVVINSFDTCYILDGDEERRLSNPLNHVADRLSAMVHIIHGSKNRIESFHAALREVGFDDPPIPVFNGIATAYGVTTKDEQENGTLLIDVGAGTTEYVLLSESGIYHSGVLPIGGEHLANDLSLGLDLNLATCRKLLAGKNHLKNQNSDKTFLKVSGSVRGSARKIPVNSIEKIIDLRLRETFSIIRDELNQKRLLSKIASGVVLSGGVATLPQSTDILASVFKCPVRIGSPLNVSGAVTDLSDSRYGTICGLLKYGRIILEIEKTGLDGGRSLSGLVDWLDYCSSGFFDKIKALKDAIRI